MKTITETTKSKLIPGELYMFKDALSFTYSSPFICCCDPMELEGYFAMADGLVDSKSIMLFLEVTEHQCHASTDNCKVAKFLCEERTMFFLEKTSIYNPLEESVYNLEDLIGICTHD